MINQQLVDYIKQQLQAGVSKDVVRKALVDAGWPAADIDDSMKTGDSVASPAAAVSTTSPAAQPTINPMVAMGGVDPAVKRPLTVTGPAKASAGDKFFAQSPALQMQRGADD